MAVVAPLLGLLDSPRTIMDLVGRLQSDFNYIFPRRSNTNVSLAEPKRSVPTFLFQSNVLVGVPQTGRPFRSTILISVIRDLFFSGNMLFVTQHQDQFPSRQEPNGDVIWEVPKAMVALVATAVYLSLFLFVII